jgi:hypothetical protein
MDIGFSQIFRTVLVKAKHLKYSQFRWLKPTAIQNSSYVMKSLMNQNIFTAIVLE